MNIELIRTLSTIAVAVITVLGVMYASRTQRGSREHKMVDQLQEEMKSMRERMDRFEARDRVYIPFILKQQNHIEMGLGPPAPPIPKVIRDFLDDVS